jgi:hypothetical protein
MNTPPKVLLLVNSYLSLATVSLGGIAFVMSVCILAPSAVAQTTGPITAPPTQTAPQKSAQDAPKPATSVNLAGIWKLNKDQSDDPRKAIQKAIGNSGGQRHGGWGMRGPGGIGVGHGGYGGRRGGGDDQGRDSANSATDMADFSRLTIEQTDSTARVTGATGRVLALYSANDTGAAKGPEEDTYTPPAAKWQGDQLVVVTPGGRGAKTTRTYSQSPGSKQLKVTTRLENPRFSQPVTFNFVYDPVKAEPGSPSK